MSFHVFSSIRKRKSITQTQNITAGSGHAYIPYKYSYSEYTQPMHTLH